MLTLPSDWKGPRPPLTIAEAGRLVAAARAQIVVLVEGWSDQSALETLAGRLGMAFADRGIAVLPIGGATNARAFARHFGHEGQRLRLAGLYDRPEGRHFLHAIGGDARPGLDESAARGLGFHACDRDLEDELIRALGQDAVEHVIAAEATPPEYVVPAPLPPRRPRPEDADSACEQAQQPLAALAGDRAGRGVNAASLRALTPRHLPR